MDSLKIRRKSFIGFTVIIAVVFSFFLAGCKVETTPEHPDGEETKQFTVTFVLNDGSEATDFTVEVEEGKSLERPEAPVREGYSFDDWYTDEEFSQVYDFATPVTESFTLYAKWNILSFKVTFETDGGSEIEEQTVEYKAYASKPVENPEKENCTFKGWFKDEECTESFDFLSGITADTVIYAGWNFLGYKVTFNTNGGSKVSSQSVAENASAKRPKEPSKSGYNFSGWFSDEALETAFDFETILTEDITLYAKWTIKTFTIKFYSESETLLTSQTVEYGNKVAEPEETPVKEHYTFAGWYSDMALRTPYDFESPVTGDISLYAKWNILSYKATFISEDQTVTAEYTLNYLSTITKPTNPSRTGYTFNGWFTDNTFKTEFDFTKGITADVKIYAKWTINTYTIKFVTNGGSSVTDVSVDYNTSLEEPTAPTKEYYTFAGWFKDSKLTKPYDFTGKITAAFTLYAKWNIDSYTVSFNSNGGSEIAPASVNYNSVVRAPAAPEKTGYTFQAWYTDAELTNAFDFTTKITGNLNLYAKYTINTYTVSFNTNGGSEITAVQADYNTLITAPANPSRQYYTFGGWYTDSALTAAFSFASPVTESFTLYAKWNVITHTISFDTDGGDPYSSVTVNEGSSLNLSALPVKTGYTFIGWYTDSAKTNPFNFSELILDDITLYAKWEITKYKVSFYTDGGTEITSQTINHGSKATRPATDPTKHNCNFIGWYTTEAATSTFDFDKPITSAVTVYAGWEINGWQIKFETNGAGVIPSQVISKDGSEPVVQPDPITKNHYNFDGWYEDAELTSAFTFGSAVSENKTLYAKWTPVVYTVSFYVDGSLFNTVPAAYGTSITLTDASPKAHYNFVGWFTDQNRQFTEATIVEGDISLYARYSEIIWTVAFNTNGGGRISSMRVNDGQTISPMPADPSRTGYTFDGWYTDSGLATAFDASSAVSDNITLYAKWNINYYRVDFDSNNGSYVNFQNVAYNSTVTKPADPTKNHMVFAGWYTDAGLTRTFNFGTKITEAITLYAKWTDLMYTVSFETNGGSSVAPIQVKDATVIPASVMPANPTRRGYTFERWYVDSELSSAFDQTLAVHSDHILYAKWNINTYTVSFETAGGSTVDSVTVNWNTSVTEPAAPTKDHMDFAGWYSNEGLSTAYNFSSKITADTILYAKWTPKERKISFNTNGGSTVNTLTFNEGSSAVRPANPTKGDEIFVGWFTDEALTQAFNFTADSAQLTQDITLYAKWKDYALTTSVTVVEQSEPFKVTFTKDSYGKITFTSDSVGGWNVDLDYLYNASSYTFDPAKHEKGIYIITLNVVINGQNYSYKAQVEVQ